MSAGVEKGVDLSNWQHTFSNEENRSYDRYSSFVNFILEQLGGERKNLTGLYAGLANGVDYSSLLRKKANLYAFDESKGRTDQIIEDNPAAKNKISPIDLKKYTATGSYQYIVGQELFQQGGLDDLNATFAHAHQALLPKGRLFLNVNSSETPVENYDKKFNSDVSDGFTIVKNDDTEGAKLEHFYTPAELSLFAKIVGFSVIKMYVNPNWESKIHSELQKN